MAKIGDVINGYEISVEKNVGGFCNSYFVKNGAEEYFLKEYGEPKQTDPLFEGFFNNQEIIIKRLNEMGSITEKFVDRFIDNGCYYQVKELLRGISLREYLDTHGEYADRKQLSIILCGVLRSLHSKNIVHQDLKPEQVMLVDDELGRKTKLGYRIILSDFDWSIPDGNIVQAVGTPFYKSPEHYKNQVPNVKSDIFTLGIMIYELLTGRNPYNLDDEPSDEDLCKRVLSGKIYSEPRKINDEIDEEINKILLRCLEVNPEKRPTIEEIQGAIVGTAPAATSSSTKPAGVSLSKFTLQSGSSKLIIYQDRDLDRMGMKIFFKDLMDKTGDPLYKYFDSDKPMLLFKKDGGGGFTVCSPNKTKNYFLLNDTRIEEEKLGIKMGDKLNLYSTSLSKIVGSFEITM
jgi:serine/threonine protein kinase